MAYYEAIQAMLKNPGLPECAAQCIDAICPGVNATESCICASRRLHYPPWQTDLDSCMFDGCFQSAYLETASLTYHACDMPQPEMSLIPLIVVTAIVEIAFFTIRVWVMRKKGHSRGFDDITISIAFALLMLWVPILSLEEHFGFYKNVYSGYIVGLDHVTEVFFAYEIVYCTALGFTKSSIAFLYFRILDGKLYRWLLWITQAFNFLLVLSFLIGLFLACNPLPRYWIYSWEIVGTCSDVWDWGGYYMGLNLLLDIWLIVLPSHYVWKTVMDRKTKIGVVAMFCLGLVTMTMTAMRFVEMRLNAVTIAGDDLMQGLLWGTLEVTTAFVIACLPSTRLFVQHFFPRLATKVTGAFSGASSKSHTRSGTGPNNGGSGFGFASLASADGRGGGFDSKNRRSKNLGGPTLTEEREMELEEVPLHSVRVDEEPRMVGHTA